MFTAPLFWLVLLAGAALGSFLPATAYRARAVMIAGASLLLLWRVLDLEVGLVLAVGSILWVVAGLRWAQAWATGRPTLAALGTVAPVLLLWVAGKEAAALRWEGGQWLVFVGVTYLLTKAWTLAKDAADGRVNETDPAVIFAYFLHFPGWVSGPMHTYTEFDGAIRKPSVLDGEGLVDVVFRIALGFVKLQIVGPLLHPASLAGIGEGVHPSFMGLAVACMAYSIVIWADFSGYSDVAIATSRLLGVPMPENFNAPYLASNIRDFWQRWHITFSRVLTGYLFIPMSRALLRRWPERPRAVAAVSTLLTFAVCGYWHGPTPNFMLWGIYHGVGLVAYDLYSSLPAVKARKRSLLKAGKARRWVGRAAATAVTFVFVSVGWILFVLPVHVLLGGRS